MTHDPDENNGKDNKDSDVRYEWTMVLPSELCCSYHDDRQDMNVDDDDDDYGREPSQDEEEVVEGQMLEMMSSICTLDETVHPTPDARTVMTSLVGHDGAISNSNSNSRNKRNANDGSTSAEWRIGLEFLAEKISKLTPFSAHGIARQSLLFHDDDERRLLPLIVCVQCLERIPPSPVQRWKRWQSIVCETIVLFQDRIGLEMERIVDNEEANNDESDDDPLDVPDAVVLWVEGVLQKLDLSFLIADNNRHQSCHLGVWAGLVGTTLRMVETFPQHTELLLEGLKRRNDGNLAPMELILLHPWRQHSSGSVVKKHSGSYQDTDEANGDENEPMVVLPADHLISEKRNFQNKQIDHLNACPRKCNIFKCFVNVVEEFW